ncbi:hypothetical protein EBT25_17590 [bacterium]|jgi:hypothetical protein|nr:hypothetical protein [bacterium]
MQYGLRKSLEDIAYELKGIKNILGSMWHSRYSNGETDALNPEAFADEYISTEECGRRLGVSDQTIRNWIAIGRKTPDKGWVEGIHYVNISPDEHRKAVLRIPWNRLIQSFAKNEGLDLRNLRANYRQYQNKQEFLE